MKSLKESFIKAKDLDNIKTNISYYVVLPFGVDEILLDKTKQYISEKKDLRYFNWYILNYSNIENTFLKDGIDADKTLIFKSYKRIEDIKTDIIRCNCDSQQNRIEYFKKLKYDYLDKYEIKNEIS